jgi:four helix bundle protein
MKDFRELKVWNKAHALTVSAYKITKNFPGEELYGLTSQIRRSCSSIPANIAEGCGRYGDKELARFFQIALGSASEFEYHILLAHDLGLLDALSFESMSGEIIEIKQHVVFLH